jgi:hypothetical protein
MCQGVIGILVSFKAGGKTKRIVLTGIGSHSQLLAANKKKLKRAGWKEKAKGERVVSIESDFSAWNKFTVESGEPSRVELSLLKNAYKKCARDAKHLISHVKKCGQIDEALVNLLSESARTEYKRVAAPALAEYERVVAPALAECKRVEARAWIKLFSIKANRVSHLQ